MKQDKAWLLATAKAVARKLKLQCKGTRLRVRMPNRATTTNTDGWSAVVGNLGKGQPRLEVWLDRFSGYSDRKFFACLRSEKRKPIVAITNRVARKLWPSRVVTRDDLADEQDIVLAKRLRRSEFNSPLLEKYPEGRTFYGIYDPTREISERINPYFCSRAVAFFEDVARALPRATIDDEQLEAYPRFENRKRVASHLQRERSRLLATECKIRDNYKCQVCGLRFDKVYGEVGVDFAEAHHRVPLNQLRGRVQTKLQDLTTVCAK
jgi:5-methylcytosine-specific restriction endonuclease McrA